MCHVSYSHTSRYDICMVHPQVDLHIPDEMGCEHTLPDGVKVMVRLRLDTTNPATGMSLSGCFRIAGHPHYIAYSAYVH